MPNSLVIAGGTTSAVSAIDSAWHKGTDRETNQVSMSRRDWTARQAFGPIAELQALIREKTLIDWTIDGRTYPARGEATEL